MVVIIREWLFLCIVLCIAMQMVVILSNCSLKMYRGKKIAQGKMVTGPKTGELKLKKSQLKLKLNKPTEL